MFGLKLGPARTTDPKPTRGAGPESAPSAETEPPTSGVSRLSPIASAVVLAAGAGVAFWWWTQWARGRAETEAEADLAADAEPPADLKRRQASD
jgi:uncharacterized protein HemX